MKTLIREGKSTQAIIADFMKENNYSLDDFKFEVVEKGSAGFLNLFGNKLTKIQFIIPDIIDAVRNYVDDFLTYMKIDFEDIKINEKTKTFFSINIIGVKDAGFLIGKGANFIDSVQLLLSQMINKKAKRAIQISLDVDGYREKKRDALLRKVKAISESVKKKQKSITLEPMNAANRRHVHKFLDKDKSIKTITVGDGEFKRIVLLPEKTNRKKA